MKTSIIASAACLFCLAPRMAASEPPLASVQISSLDISKAAQGYGQPQSDKSVDGHPLTLHDQAYGHGFGTHAPGLLEIDLHQNTQRFEATVGVDDEVGPGKGRVEFQVWGDGKLLWKSRVLNSGDVPQAVSVLLTGVSRLVLRVTTAGMAYNFDHADWADARLEMATAGTKEPPETIRFQPFSDTPQIAMLPPSDAPQIHLPASIGIHPGTPFLWTVPVTGLRPLIFTAGHLPPGLALNKNTGTISGTLAKAGDYFLRVRVRNRAGTEEHLIHIIAGKSLALTPPMGWNSYDAYGDSVTEAEVLANADYVHDVMQP